jgi:predicted nucleotidyltransferase component of viral defense system
VIEPSEMRAWAARTGTTEAQIRKDHLVSHLLRGLEGREGIVLYGGTALNRTHVQGRRLSEDIDLYRTHGSPADPDDLTAWLGSATRREFPDLRIEPTGVRGDVLDFAARADDLSVKIQIVGQRYERSKLPVSASPVELRYSDLPPSVEIVVPTLGSFTAMKLAAYEDRFAPRDLFDLGSLDVVGAIDAEALGLLRRLRGTGPTRWAYEAARCPSREEWMVQLAHQTADPGDPAATLNRVRSSLDAVAGWTD